MGLNSKFRATELGPVPVEWDIKLLSEVSEKIMVGIASAATHAYRHKGVVMFRNQNIKPNFLDDSDVLYLAEQFEETFKNKRLKDGDLLTARTGYPGTTSIVPAIYEGAQSFTTLITRPRKAAIVPKYLCFYINSELGQTYFSQHQIGGGQKNVNAGSLKNLPILIPPTRSEQEAIAEALTDADALIVSLEQLLTKKRHVKQGAMQELLTGKKRMPGFFKKWDAKLLCDISLIFSGGTPSTANPSYYNGRIPWIVSGDLNQGFIKNVRNTISKLGLDNSSAKMIAEDSLLIALYGATAGVAAISKVTAAINQAVLAVIPHNDSSLFLYYKFSYLKDWLIATYTQGGQPNLSGKIIKNIELMMPCVEEQTAIAQILSDMDAELTALEAKLVKARHIKQGMMQQLLTGKIRFV